MTIGVTVYTVMFSRNVLKLHCKPLYVLVQAPFDVPEMVRWLLGPDVLERTAVLSALSSM